ncbi:MAG: phage BR0599 family protein [Moraxellaceae bacterium]|nr:phage BR0599 family protein [Moraxellaceae bacterium]
MIAAVINGQPAWLLPYMPNNDSPVALAAKVPTELQRSLSGAGSRRPQGGQMRHALEWSADLRAADYAALRNATQAAQNEPVAVPVWPFAIRVAHDASVITAGLTVAWTEDWATWEINPASFAGYDYAAPLLYGYLRQSPRLAAQNDDMVTADFAVDEDAPAALGFAPAGGVLAADTTFPTALGYAAPVFPFQPDWNNPPTPGLALTAVDREEVGPGRLKSTTFYPQLPELTHEATFRFADAASAAGLLEWWRRRAGMAGEHWIAGSQAVGRLSTAAAAGTNVLNFRAPIALGANVYIALFSPDETLELGRVAASASQQITLAANLALSWGPSLTSVTPAMLARHTNDELVIEFERARAGWIGSSTLAWREVAPEYAPNEIEIRGTTLGRLTAAAWFFQIDLDYNGALQTWHLTNWESGATANLIDWTYNACDFDKLFQSVDLEDDSCMVSFRYFAGGPWDNWLPSQLSARGFITISRADVSSAGVFSNFRQVWKGELKTPKMDGPNVRQKALGANALFARMGPRQVMSKTCGTMLFKPRCGLALADWTFNAVITAVAGNVVTIGTITRAIGGALPAGFGAADWFALDWMGWGSAGLPYRDGVLSSTALASGEIQLTLERVCLLEVASTVTVVPGCDRQGSTCRDKFGNGARFRGFEFMPAVSPSLVIAQRNTTSAKK